MKVNKALGFVTVLAFSATLMCASAYAATYSIGALQDSTGVVEGEAGADVIVPVAVTPDDGETEQVNGYVMTLTYDPDLATPVWDQVTTDLTGGVCYATAGAGFEDGILVSDKVTNAETGKETLVVAWAAANPVSVDTAANLATVEFKVNDSAAEDVEVAVAVTQLSNDGTVAEDGTFTVASGKIDLAEATTGLLGDVNGDGNVDITDVNILTQYINNVFTDLETNYVGATYRSNVNKDENVDVTDVNILTQYVNKVISSFE